MRFIVDEAAGMAVIEFLRAAGHDVLAVREIMPQADDTQIFRRAASEERILITNDKDFGELVFRTGQVHQGVLLLRLRDESSISRVRMVKLVLEKYVNRLRGHFVVATERAVRVRS